MRAVLFSIFFVVTSINAQEMQWRDASGRDYVLLDGLKTWNETEKECSLRGLAIFDARFVSEADRNSFLKSDLFQNLNWSKVFPGTPREGSVASIWQASQVGIISGGADLGSTTWLHLKRGDKVSSTQEMKGTNERVANGVCMSVESFWQRCTSEFKCTFNSGHSEWSWRYLFVDYGSTENEAYKRIIERTEQPKWSVSEGKCGLVTSSMRCMRVLP